MNMIFIPGGKFRMSGRTELVTVADFWMDETPVTVAQYLEAVKAGACKSDHKNWNISGIENHPVNFIDWHQASAYAKWAGKRLPTEQEWEWAARGGDEARLYPWGNEEPSNLLCWEGRYDKPTCPVGSYPKGNSRHGLKDMMGLSQWMAGSYPNYPNHFHKRVRSSVKDQPWYSYYPSGDEFWWLTFRCAK